MVKRGARCNGCLLCELSKGLVAALSQLLLPIVVPGSLLVHNACGLRCIQQAAQARDPGAEHDVKLRDLVWWSHLVLHHLQFTRARKKLLPLEIAHYTPVTHNHPCQNKSFAARCTTASQIINSKKRVRDLPL